MTKKQYAEWLATVSWSNGDNTYKGRDTKEKWVAFYMTFTLPELKAEYQSYMC